MYSTAENSNIYRILFLSIGRARFYTVLGSGMNESLWITIVVYQNFGKRLNRINFFRCFSYR